MLQCLSTADCRWCPDTRRAEGMGWDWEWGAGPTAAAAACWRGGLVRRGGMGHGCTGCGSCDSGPWRRGYADEWRPTTASRQWPYHETQMSVALCVYSHGLTGSDSGSRDTYSSLMSGTGGCISAHWSGCLAGYYWVLRVDWCSGDAKHSTSSSNYCCSNTVTHHTWQLYTRPTHPVISLMACLTTRTTHPRCQAACWTFTWLSCMCYPLDGTAFTVTQYHGHSLFYCSQPWLATSAAVRHLVTNR